MWKYRICVKKSSIAENIVKVVNEIVEKLNRHSLPSSFLTRDFFREKFPQSDYIKIDEEKRIFEIFAEDYFVKVFDYQITDDIDFEDEKKNNFWKVTWDWLVKTKSRNFIIDFDVPAQSHLSKIFDSDVLTHKVCSRNETVELIHNVLSFFEKNEVFKNIFFVGNSYYEIFLIREFLNVSFYGNILSIRDYFVVDGKEKTLVDKAVVAIYPFKNSCLKLFDKVQRFLTNSLNFINDSDDFCIDYSLSFDKGAFYSYLDFLRLFPKNKVLNKNEISFILRKISRKLKRDFYDMCPKVDFLYEISGNMLCLKFKTHFHDEILFDALTIQKL